MKDFCADVAGNGVFRNTACHLYARQGYVSTRVWGRVKLGLVLCDLRYGTRVGHVSGEDISFVSWSVWTLRSCLSGRRLC